MAGHVCHHGEQLGVLLHTHFFISVDSTFLSARGISKLYFASSAICTFSWSCDWPWLPAFELPRSTACIIESVNDAHKTTVRHLYAASAFSHHAHARARAHVLCILQAFSSSLDVAAAQLEVGRTRSLDFDHELKTAGWCNVFSGVTGESLFARVCTHAFRKFVTAIHFFLRVNTNFRSMLD